MKKEIVKREIPIELFSTCRNWFINYIQQNIDECYRFGSSSAVGEGENKKMANIEAQQFKNILKLLVYRVKTKFPDISQQEINYKVFQGLQMITIFAHENNYVVTAINLKTKLNNIIQHIINESRISKDTGFSISSATEWLNRA